MLIKLLMQHIIEKKVEELMQEMISLKEMTMSG